MSEIFVRKLGTEEYSRTWRQMQDFTQRRSADTKDEIWLVQHLPVFTQGLSCSALPVRPTHIEVIHTDRGGQMTYHGPGQLIIYPLIDLKRRKIGIKRVVDLLEQCVIDYLADHDINADRIGGAPGVYVNKEKIAALGLRVRRGATYHGLSFNVDMDLSPFSLIDPCGYKDLVVTQLKDLGVNKTIEQVEDVLVNRFIELLTH
ncbi:MAG: lipoyl(octanoyl) transferase LipB [Arenicellales bacterium]|nr:lipoyl(octanoyl) transferase LipB [Arenicellales bacterium]